MVDRELVASGQKTVDISKYSYQRVFMEEYSLNPGYNKWMTETAPEFKIHTGRRSHGRWKSPEGIDFGSGISIPVTHAKIFGWYDNEFGSYVNRLGDLACYFHNQMW